jgi:hypothetical protein
MYWYSYTIWLKFIHWFNSYYITGTDTWSGTYTCMHRGYDDAINKDTKRKRVKFMWAFSIPKSLERVACLQEIYSKLTAHGVSASRSAYRQADRHFHSLPWPEGDQCGGCQDTAICLRFYVLLYLHISLIINVSEICESERLELILEITKNGISMFGFLERHKRKAS